MTSFNLILYELFDQSIFTREGKNAPYVPSKPKVMKKQNLVISTKNLESFFRKSDFELMTSSQ